LGGEFSLVFNAGEVRQKLWRFLGVVGFIDGGNVFALGRQFTFGALRWTGGYGLRAETRMGILRVDQGFIIDRKPGEKPMKIVFSLGQAF
jgi:outer membrane protein assembly factor BamA